MTRRVPVEEILGPVDGYTCFGCGRVRDILLCMECGELAARLSARLRDAGYPDPPGFDINGWLVPLIVNEIGRATQDPNG